MAEYFLFISHHPSLPALLNTPPLPLQGSVFGRIEIARSMTVSIDSMKLSSIFSFERGVGAVRVLVSGNGPTILRSGISISNNEIYGETLL